MLPGVTENVRFRMPSCSSHDDSVPRLTRSLKGHAVAIPLHQKIRVGAYVIGRICAASGAIRSC